MVEHFVGRVAELWRYPVKSMLGERRNQLPITPCGVLGDRAWALRETATGRIASAKRFAQLLAFHARFEVEPTFAEPGRIQITLPDGRTICPDDPDASAIVSDFLGLSVRLENQPASDEKTAIDRATVFGDVPVSTMKAEWTPETMPDYFQLMTGTFFEIGAVFILASGSVDHLGKLQGGTAQIDRRRFRPNIYVESEAKWSGFVEDSWMGGVLNLGGAVRVEGFQPTVWCVVSTLAQQELPRDLSILRTTAQHHRGCFGVYATVTRSGLLQVGDAVYLVNQETDTVRSMAESA
jgi:MOSC domain-containing protein